MRITSRLVVPPDLESRALARWQEAGGSAATIRRRSAEGVHFLVNDRDSEEGRRLTALAKELGATASGPVLLSQSVVYDAADVERAELLLLDVGTLDDDVVDPASLTRMHNCPKCGLPIDPIPGEGGVRLRGPEIAKYDLFSAEMLHFVSDALADRIRGFRGVKLVDVAAPRGACFWLTASSSLGYPAGGVRWSEPCERCGQRRGTSDTPYLTGLDVYPRSAWDGSDANVTAMYPNGVIVTQALWRSLADKKWRVPEPGVSARPIQLDDRAQPLR